MGPMKQERRQKQIVYDIVMQHLPVGFSIVDKDGMITEFNPSAELLMGYSRDEVIGKSHLEVFHAAGGGGECPLLKNALSMRERVLAAEVTTKKKSGERITISVTTAPLFDDEGALTGAVELFRDISDIKRRERERKNILSMFAHDMKNPVAVSGGVVARLLSGKAGDVPEKQRAYLETIQEELYKVSDLLADFLEFSRIEAKAYLPVVRPFDVENELRRSIEAAKVTADKKNLTILLEVSGEISSALPADPAMINRVIANLLDNAIAYTDAGGSIRVSLTGQESVMVVSVSDTGRGMTGDQLQYVFDAFYRGSTDASGAGLGLFIVKSIVEAHGGSVWVESMPGEGSTFSFTLPKY